MANKAFTIVELLIVIAIISLLSAILGGAWARSRENAKLSVCADNLNQIGLAVAMYAGDNDGYVPPIMTQTYKNLKGQIVNGDVKRWRDLLLVYTENENIFFCPDDPHPGTEIPNPGVDRNNSLYTSYTTDFMLGDFGSGNSLLLNIDNPLKASLPYIEDKVFYVLDNKEYSGYSVLTFHGNMRNVVYLDTHTQSAKIGEN